MHSQRDCQVIPNLIIVPNYIISVVVGKYKISKSVLFLMV